MKGVFGVLSLLLVLVIVVFSVKLSFRMAGPAASIEGAASAAHHTRKQQMQAVQQELHEAMARGSAPRASEAD